MEESCQQCGKTISRRAKANVWGGERIVCTPCLKELEGAERRQQAAYSLAGKPGTPWTVSGGGKRHGPFPTNELIELLRQGRVDWMWDVWRDGMTAWRKAANLFTIPELSDGRIELRDFGQGDGTYHSARA